MDAADQVFLAGKSAEERTMQATLPSLKITVCRENPLVRARLLVALAATLLSTVFPTPAGSLPGSPDGDRLLVDELLVSRVIGPALLDAAQGSSFCPAGWEDLGAFDLTAYVLARESEFARGPSVEAPCGLEQTYYSAFLYGDGVRMQGSGRALDGSIVHYAGNSCFEVVRCPLAANGRCATVGRTVAVDPRVIPLGSELLIEGLGLRRAEDTGGGIRGNHIDVYYGEELTYRGAMGMSRADRRVCKRSSTASI
jgi:hypothetical protein